jgi:hypothetical protein
MLENMIAQDHIERVISKGYLMKVEMVVGQRGFEIGGQVIDVFQLPEPVKKTLLGSHMHELPGLGKEIRLFLQIKPYQAVPFERKAGRTKHI